MENLSSIIQKSISSYLVFGSRSNKKLIPLHSFIADTLKEKTELLVNALPDKEKQIQGKFYSKKVDICISNEIGDFGMVSIKFIMSNYLQNSNNYFESLIGELINLKINGLVKWFILFVFEDLPYFDKNGNIKHYEKFSNDKFKRYLELLDHNILDFLTIITISGGKSLVHPKNYIGNYNIQDHKVIQEFPVSFLETSLNFIKKVNSNSN
jgi:hypothetical protein